MKAQLTAGQMAAAGTSPGAKSNHAAAQTHTWPLSTVLVQELN